MYIKWQKLSQMSSDQVFKPSSVGSHHPKSGRRDELLIPDSELKRIHSLGGKQTHTLPAFPDHLFDSMLKSFKEMLWSCIPYSWKMTSLTKIILFILCFHSLCEIYLPKKELLRICCLSYNTFCVLLQNHLWWCNIKFYQATKMF